VIIRDGHLWKINFLEGIGQALFIPEFKDAVFTDAQATFTVQDRRITSDDIFLQGKLADLSGEGWIDFDKNIRFLIIPSFKETEILKSRSMKKGPTVFLSQAEGYLNILISGTLDHPTYSVDTLPTKVIKKATDSLFQGVQGIFDEIF